MGGKPRKPPPYPLADKLRYLGKAITDECGLSPHVVAISDELKQTAEDLEEERKRRLSCYDCGDHGPGYMVYDHVWQASGMNPLGGTLCFVCLEKRLGRRLTVEDFEDQPINRSIFFGWNLRDGAFRSG